MLDIFSKEMMQKLFSLEHIEQWYLLQYHGIINIGVYILTGTKQVLIWKDKLIYESIRIIKGVAFTYMCGMQLTVFWSI